MRLRPEILPSKNDRMPWASLQQIMRNLFRATSLPNNRADVFCSIATYLPDHQPRSAGTSGALSQTFLVQFITHLRPAPLHPEEMKLISSKEILKNKLFAVTD